MCLSKEFGVADRKGSKENVPPQQTNGSMAKWNVPFSEDWQKVLEKYVGTLQQHVTSPELISVVDCMGRDLGFIWNDDNKLELFDVPEPDIFPLVIRSQERNSNEEAHAQENIEALEESQPVHGNSAQALAAKKAAQRARDEAAFEEQFSAWQDRHPSMQASRPQPEKEQPKHENHESVESTAQQDRPSQESIGKTILSEADIKRDKIESFLGLHGFSKVNSKRMGKFGRYKYPLHTAVKREPKMLPLLLEAGADPSRKNSSGLTPLQYAQKLKAFDAERLLCDRPAFHRGVKQS